MLVVMFFYNDLHTSICCFRLPLIVVCPYLFAITAIHFHTSLSNVRKNQNLYQSQNFLLCRCRVTNAGGKNARWHQHQHVIEMVINT